MMYNIFYFLREGGSVIKSNNKFTYNYFVNVGEFFYIGQILNYYDCHHNFLMNVEILNFFLKYHKKSKVPYLKVKIRFLDGCKSHIYSFIAKDFLGYIFTTKSFLDFYKKTIDKNRE